MRFQVSKNGGHGGPPPPVMVGTGVPVGPSHVTRLAAHWYQTSVNGTHFTAMVRIPHCFPHSGPMSRIRKAP